MSRFAQFLVMVCVVAGLLASAGCKSDPYSQQAIATLRAENIQLENEYYALKSQYESDMRRLGQPVPGADYYGPGVAPGFPPEYIDGNEVISSLDGSWPGVSASSNSGSMPTTDPVVLASHIRSVDVHQLPAAGRETARLLVRPLDAEGAIIPVEGALKIRLVDPQTRETLTEYEFSEREVAAWVSDQPHQQPGIHVGLPDAGRIEADRLVCDLQFRTADNRILRQQAELLFASPARTPRPSRDARSQRAEAPVLPEEIDGVEIEIGDEINFDSLGGDDSPAIPRRPVWSPDR